MIATVTLNPSLDEWVELPALRLGALNRATQFVRYPGGKGLNVSRVAHELGHATIAYLCAGGSDGAILRHHLRQMGVRHHYVEAAGATRNNYKLITRRPQALTEINTAGPRVPPAALSALLRALCRQRPPPQAVALCGSLPQGVSAALYRRWTSTLRRRRVRVLVDTSGRALREALQARPWAVKPNRQEAEEVLGRRIRSLTDAVVAAQQLRARGPEVVLLSLGAQGALMAHGVPRAVWQAVPPRVRVRSAVGAGDSFVGGFLTGCARDLGLPEALRLAVACGAAAAMTPGTTLCHRGDVQRLRPRVRLTRIV